MEKDIFKLYDKTWMSIVCKIGMIGSVIQNAHNVNLDGTEIYRSKWIVFIDFLNNIPNVIGDLLFGVAETLFIILLMQAFSHLYKPFKEWWIAVIILNVICYFLNEIETESEVYLAFALFVLITTITVQLILGIKIINNYSGVPQVVGRILTIYTPVCFIVLLVYNMYCEPLWAQILIGFFMLSAIDWIYLNMFERILSDDE